MNWRKYTLKYRAPIALALGALGAVIYLALMSAAVSFFPEPGVEAAAPCRPNDPRPECQPPSSSPSPTGPANVTVRLGWANPQLLQAHLRGLHTGVQWQAPDGQWNDVREWQYLLTNSAVVRWGVLEPDFNRGPFRWLISDAITREPLAISKPFNLPPAGGEVTSDINIGASDSVPTGVGRPTQTVVATSAALFSEPSTTASLVTLLAQGTPLDVQQAHASGQWLRVNAGTSSGWLPVAQTRVAFAPAQPPSTAPVAAPTAAPTPNGVAVRRGLLRASPAADGRIVGDVQAGAAVIIWQPSRDGQWLYVGVNGGNGWIEKDAVRGR